MKYYLGIDSGSVSVKAVILDENSSLLAKAYTPSEGQPILKLIEILKGFKETYPAINNIVATGTGKHILGDILGIDIENEIVTNMVAGCHFYPEVRTIMEIGGQDSKLIFIGKDKNNQPIITDHAMNEVCAAGTGAFLDRQAERLGITIQEFGELALKSNHPAHIAGRCTVFAKSDMIHLQQEGVPQEDIIGGLCYALARNYIANLGKNRQINEPILFQGAVAANKGVNRALENLLEKKIIIPEHYEVMGAIGAALVSKKEDRHYELGKIIQNLENFLKIEKQEKSTLASLSKTQEIYLAEVSDKINILTEKTDCFIGVDVGSISINIVVIDGQREVIYQRYYYTQGEPLKVLKEVFQELANFQEKLNILGVGITGSGRYLFGEFIGADLIKNEITSQAKAALELDKDVDTVIEIGGQDSKFIRIRNGQVTSFEMNKVCAAGTGSFLEEQAKRLKIDMEKEFSDSALKSENPLNLGAKCTVFMESDVIHYQQKGSSKEDILAGLAYAIAHNYLERVVVNRKIGSRIMFLGGVASNQAVVAAFKNILEKEIFVPDIHNNSGAYGVALLTQEARITKTKFLSLDLDKITYTASSFICPHCINHCQVKKITIQDKDFFYGGLCGRYDRKEEKEKAKALPNYFKLRNEILFGFLKNKESNRLGIGIPRIFLFYDYFAQWVTFFNTLEINVILSDETNRAIVDSGVKKAIVDTCFPIKSAYGHIQNLLDKGITKIFFPSFIEFKPEGKLYKKILCPYKANVRQFIRSSMEVEIISPVITYEAGSSNEKQAYLEIGKLFGFSDKKILGAYKKACSSLTNFDTQIEKISQQIDFEQYDKVIVIIGKRYSIYDKLMSLNIPKKFMNKGILPLPMDFLDLNKVKLTKEWQDLIWRDSQNAIKAAKIILKHSNFYPLFITYFGCGQDSFLEKHLEKLFLDRPFLELEIDEHTADAGIVTRCEAFIDTIESYIKKTKKEYLPPLFMPKKMLKSKTYYIPNNGENYLAIGMALKSFGFKAEMLPKADSHSFYLGNKFSSGKECIPYILMLGDLIKLINRPNFKAEDSVLFIPGLDHCRSFQYHIAFSNVLGELGIGMEVFAPRIFPTKDEVKDILGLKIMRKFWINWVAIDYINRKHHETKAFAVDKEKCKLIYDTFIKKLENCRNQKALFGIIKEAIKDFDGLSKEKSKKPIIALVGEPYIMFNPFANNNLVEKLEALGCVVWLPPNVSDYLLYIEKRRVSFAKKAMSPSYILKLLRLKSQESAEKKITSLFKYTLQNFPEPSIEELFKMAKPYISKEHDPICVFAIAKTLDFINKGVDGIINVMPLHCLTNYVVTAILKRITKEYKIPIIDLMFTGQQDIHIQNRLEAFVYEVKQFYKLKV